MRSTMKGIFHIALCFQWIHSLLATDNLSFRVVVARYDEAIDWLQPIFEHCTIYNKGQRLHLPNEMLLPNRGREGETYLRYIVEHYYNLPDVIVFTQAHIADHKGSNNPNILLYLKDTANKFGISTPTYIHYTNKRKPHKDWDPDWNLYTNGSWRKPQTYFQDTPILFKDFFLKHISSRYPNPLKVLACGIFAVQGKRIVESHPLSYYQHLLALLQHHIDPMEGEFMERCWYYIFTPQPSPSPTTLFQPVELQEQTPPLPIVSQDIAPWERCQELLTSLPPPSSTHYHTFLYLSILTCGLFPYQSQDLRVFPVYMHPYTAAAYTPQSGIGNGIGIGIGQYPDQIFPFLYHIRSYPIHTYVHVGITTPNHAATSSRTGDGGGFFLLLSEYLKYWKRLQHTQDTDDNDADDDVLSVGIDAWSLIQSFGLYDDTTTKLESESERVKKVPIIQDRLYQENLLSYAMNSQVGKVALIPAKSRYFVEDYWDHFRMTNPLIEVFVLDQYDQKEDLNDHNNDEGVLLQHMHEIAQVWYPFSHLLVYTHITDIRYPERKTYWQALMESFSTREYHVRTFSSQYEEIVGTTTTSSQSLSYFGIGVVTNPIYYTCNEFAVCASTPAWYRCLGILTTLSTVTHMPEEHVLAAIIASGGLHPTLPHIYAFSARMRKFFTAFPGNSLAVQQSPIQVARLLYHIWVFATLYYQNALAWENFLYVYLSDSSSDNHNIHSSNSDSGSDDGLFLLLHTWIQKWHRKVTSHYQHIHILFDHPPMNTNEHYKHSKHHEHMQRIPAWEEYHTSLFVTDTTPLYLFPPDIAESSLPPLIHRDIRTTKDTFLSDVLTSLHLFTTNTTAHSQSPRQSLGVDVIYLQTSPSVSYDLLRSYVAQIMQRSRWIIFPHIQDIRYTAMKRLWGEIQGQFPSQILSYTDSEEGIDDVTSSRNNQYLGIGVWINPQDHICTWETGILACQLAR